MPDCNVVARGSALSVPDPNAPPHKVYSNGPLPCYVILVHGVNDVGEAYHAQEKGICWGLSDRLDRHDDLKPAYYTTPKREDPSPPALRKANDPPEKVDPEPEKHCYRRTLSHDTYTPVIPFYWGFREEDGQIKRPEETWHGELLDRDGNRLDRDGAKGGGPLVNASNCLPHMWAPGWKPPFPGINFFASFSDKTHPLIKATCYRRYQVLAALRLAMLIRIIHTRHKDAAVNVVAHSMGCLISMLAQAFLMEDGEDPAQCLILNNPPYGFPENLLDGHLYEGINQTSRARIETLNKVVKAFRERQPKRFKFDDLKKPEVGNHFAGALWRKEQKRDRATGEPIPFQERDNRGKTYLYFTPHDRTVAMLNTQGIGWQGVPDNYTAEWVSTLQENGRSVSSYGSLTWPRLLVNLFDSGFRQRLFMRQKRGLMYYQVGLPVEMGGHVSLLEDGESYGSGIMMKSLPKHTKRWDNGESLSPAITFDPGDEVLPISPIDAAIALTNDGAIKVSEEFDDPRPMEERGFLSNEAWRELLNRGKPKGQQTPHITYIHDLGEQGKPGRMRAWRTETPDETRYRIQSYGITENSHHSSIVSNHWHSQAVTAYDLALGKPIRWTEEEKRFYAYLCEVADWRIKAEGKAKVEYKTKALEKTTFYANEDPKNKALIEDTATYYVEGKLPPQVDQAKTPEQLSLIHFETTGKRAPVVG